MLEDIDDTFLLHFPLTLITLDALAVIAQHNPNGPITTVANHLDCFVRTKALLSPKLFCITGLR